MKSEVQQLISRGDTESALQLLATRVPDEATLLLAQYSSGKKQYGLNLMDFSEWNRIQARVNFAALELAGKVENGDFDLEKPATSTPPADSPLVYITYSPDADDDKDTANKMRDFLLQNDIRVITNDDMELGENIEGFVNKSIKESDYILAVISSDSLSNSWRNGEAALDIVLDRISETKVIPVSLDHKVLDPDYYFESLDFLNEHIKKTQINVQKALNSGGDARHFQLDLNRLNNAKNQLSLIIEKMKSVRMVNLDNGHEVSEEQFERGMNRILKRIRNSKS